MVPGRTEQCTFTAKDLVFSSWVPIAIVGDQQLHETSGGMQGDCVIGKRVSNSASGGVRFKDCRYSQGKTLAEYQKPIATGPASISSPMKPNSRHAMNKDAVANERRSLVLQSRRTVYMESVVQRAISSAKLGTPPPDRTSTNME